MYYWNLIFYIVGLYIPTNTSIWFCVNVFGILHSSSVIQYINEHMFADLENTEGKSIIILI